MITSPRVYVQMPYAYRRPHRKKTDSRRVHPEEVMDLLCEETGFTRKQFESKSRKRELCEARFVGMAVMYEYCPVTLEAIGEKYFGGRDHSTVNHALSEIRDLSQNTSSVRRLMRVMAPQLLAKWDAATPSHLRIAA